MALTQVPSVMIDRPLVTIASASTVNIGASASDNISVTGTTTITSFGTTDVGAVRTVTFAGVLTLTHNATTLILPGSANITTAAGDVATFISLGSGNWRCVSYTKASGQAIIASASYTGPRAQVFTSTGTFTIPTGVTSLKITVVGGGGGGGGGFFTGSGGGGGGAAISYLTGLTPGNTLAVTWGAGGGSSAAGGTSSVSSGTQSISTISATGGAAGRDVSFGPNDGGSGSGGSLNFKGSQGFAQTTNSTGTGGNSIFAGGAKGQWTNQALTNGLSGVNGGGGSGCLADAYTARSGGSGGNGLIIFEW